MRNDLVDDAVATLTLMAYSIAVAVGFARVFSGWEFLSELVVVAVVGHGVSFILRQLRTPGWLAVPLVAAALTWLIAAQHARPTLRYGLPSGDTWSRFSSEVELVREQFTTAVAPVVYGVGWAALAMVAMAIVVVLADTFAFRAAARAEALVPGGVLFVFIAALASPRLRVATAVGLVGAGALAVAALRRLHRDRRRVLLRPADAPRGLGFVTAAAVAVVLALAAGFIGPRLPTADAEPLYETRGRGSGVTSIVSPLVDIRSRLTNRGNVELFRVNADAPAYWRSTTLPEFDGQTFRLPSRPLESIGAVADSDDDRAIRQRIQVLSLGGRLVPAAADPLQADGTSGGAAIDLRINRDTNTLLAPDELETGDVLNVLSAAPTVDVAALRAATSTAPDSIFVDLPDDLPDVVAETAAAVAGDQPTNYDAAIALQDYFRAFEYSLEVQAGHSGSAIENFLELRTGYCEQFSATFAAMARTLGIPSRVAVGFTPGTLGDDGFYSVIGKNAHAWPELWFDGIGWVPFEPTPGRGVPGAESYTNVPAQQDTSGPAPADPDAANTPEPVTPEPELPPTIPDLEDRLPDEEFATPPDPSGLPAGASSEADPSSRTTWVVLALAGSIVLVALLPWLSRRGVRRLRRPDAPPDRVVASWHRAQRAVERAGVAGAASNTPHEWAMASSDQLPAATRQLGSLADAVDVALFAPNDDGRADEATAERSEELADQVVRVAVDTLPPSKRVVRHFSDWS